MDVVSDWKRERPAAVFRSQSRMKPGEIPRGSIPEVHVALFRRLDKHLKGSPATFEAAPFLSLIFEQLASGARPNILFGWQPREAGERLEPYYRALLDAYLDHLVHADLESPDVQQANQLLQDILDGMEPDQVLGFEAAEPTSRADASRPRQVVYAFRTLLELDTGTHATNSVAAKDAPSATGLDAAINRAAERCNVSPSAVEAAYADPAIRAEAAKLLEQQVGLTPEMHAAAIHQAEAEDALTDRALASEYASEWLRKYSREE